MQTKEAEEKEKMLEEECKKMRNIKEGLWAQREVASPPKIRMTMQRQSAMGAKHQKVSAVAVNSILIAHNYVGPLK
ncbi:hypothetical protein AB6A40_003938 [Gnathostoma spinigerum]|uniref:Uncharacterized protein n=1 Tax=Gnathostoma spinigerum TaxID=75299 RepID=A0ABD6EGH3_9BILA